MWLLAHPDDEIFGIPFWHDVRNETIFYYFVTKPEIRVKESQALIGYLREKNLRIQAHFATDDFVDGKLSQCLSEQALKSILSKVELFNPDRLIVLAAEGGHQDHDFVNCLAVLISNHLKIPLIQLFSYSKALTRPGFRIMNGRKGDSSLMRNKFIFAWMAFKLSFIYSSQWKTWIGLLPGILIKYTRRNFYYISPHNSTAAIENLPPLYETRKRSNLEFETEQLTKLKILFASTFE